jgi:hypothetical protein
MSFYPTAKRLTGMGVSVALMALVSACVAQPVGYDQNGSPVYNVYPLAPYPAAVYPPGVYARPGYPQPRYMQAPGYYRQPPPAYW